MTDKQIPEGNWYVKDRNDPEAVTFIARVARNLIWAEGEHFRIHEFELIGPVSPLITVQVKRMRLSGNRTDYYVEIQCGGRSLTPYVFRDRFKAQYETDHFAWVFGLRPDEPDVLTYNEESYPND